MPTLECTYTIKLCLLTPYPKSFFLVRTVGTELVAVGSQRSRADLVAWIEIPMAVVGQ